MSQGDIDSNGDRRNSSRAAIAAIGAMVGVGLGLALGAGASMGARAIAAISNLELAPAHPSPPRANHERILASCAGEWAAWVARRHLVPLREFTVRVVADEEFRATAGERWADDVRARISRASALFERDFRISFRVVDVQACATDNAAKDLQLLLRTKTIDWVRDDADFLVAFTAQHHGATERAYDRGVSSYYGRSTIVRTGMPNSVAPWPYEDETVLHELLHLFGAWHVDNMSSVMRADKRGPAVSGVDVLCAANVLLTRELDFRRGADAIDDSTWSTITDRWRNAWRWDVGHPGLDSYAQRVLVERERKRPDAAQAAARSGMALVKRMDLANNVDDFLRRAAEGK